jgi:chromosome partitioning protein
VSGIRDQTRTINDPEIGHMTTRHKVPTIAFANLKGGVGKSTITLQTAYYLSQKIGFADDKKLLVVDFDPQGNTSTRMLQRTDIEDAGGTRSHQLFKEKLDVIKPVLTPCGADLIYATQNDTVLDDIELQDMDVFINPMAHLAKLAESGKYAAILIDCPPSRSRKLIAALACATDIIVPVEVSGFAKDALTGIMKSIETAEQVNPDVRLTGVIINKFASRSHRHVHEKNLLKDALGDLLFEQTLSFRTPLDEANSLAIPIWSMGKGSARAAATEIKAVCEEIIRRTGLRMNKPVPPKKKSVRKAKS